jgi:hypothetical protein
MVALADVIVENRQVMILMVSRILMTYNNGQTNLAVAGVARNLGVDMGTLFPRQYLLAVTVLMLRCILPCHDDDVTNQSWQAAMSAVH